MKHRAIILSLLLVISNSLSAKETYDVVIPADEVTVSEYENSLESRLTQDISAYLGNTNFVVSIDADISKIQRMEKEQTLEQLDSSDEIADYQLPGTLPNIRPHDLKAAVLPSKDKIQTTFRKINKISVKLTLDSGISQEQEDFVKNLVSHKANLDQIRGDNLEISKANFTKSSIGDMFNAAKNADASSLGQNALYYLIIGVIAFIFIVGGIVLCVVLIRKFKNKDSQQSQKTATTQMSPAAASESISESMSPRLEYTKQDLVSISLSNKGLAEEMLNEVKMGQDAEKVLASIYLTLGERLFHKLYPNTDMSSIKAFIKNNPLDKEEIADHFEQFTTQLAERNESGGVKYRPFHFLDNLDNSQVLYLLQEESPKITALALSQLPAGRAAEVIQSINKAEQASVAFELSQFDKLPIESFKDIANKLAIRAQRVPSYSNIDIDGIQLLLNMLDNMSQAGVNEFLSKLQSDSPDTYYKLRDIFFIFDDLMRIPTKILKTIVREFPRNDIAVSLQDVSEEFSAHILEALPNRLTSAVVEEISLNKGKLKQQQIDDAKQNITNIVRHLIKHNRLAVADLVKLDSKKSEESDN